jgi:hypothetical protein
MNPVPRGGNTSQKEIQEFLDNGGSITKCPPGKRSEEIDFKGGFYTKRKKQKEEKEGNE